MLAIVGFITVGNTFGLFPTVTYSPYDKDVYIIQLFKSEENVGFSLITKGIAIPSYSKIGNYELRALNRNGIVIESYKFNFDDTIMVEPNPDCITEEEVIITNTQKCPPFKPMIKLESSSIILIMQFSLEITEFQVLKDGKIIAVRKLFDEPIFKQDPFTEVTESIQGGIVDKKAQRLFESGSSGTL